MRKKYTFLLTILPTEDDNEALRGRLQLVQSNRAETFTNMDELRQLINRALLANTQELMALTGPARTAEAAQDSL